MPERRQESLVHPLKMFIEDVEVDERKCTGLSFWQGDYFEASLRARAKQSHS
jgi:hypothetical protein